MTTKTSYGLDVDQFRTLVVRPVLQYLSLHSGAAENLLIGTALQESRLRYLHQLGSGPALGVYQMEPATYNDIYYNYLEYRDGLEHRVNDLRDARPTTLEEELVYNLAFATAMARVHYKRVPRALPGAQDIEGLAAYWKRWYNTPLGAGTVDEAIPHFQIACNP